MRRSSVQTLVVLAAAIAGISAVHCSSSSSGSSGSSCALGDADPTTIRHLTADQQTLVAHAADRTKAALSPAEWRYLFKLRYLRFSRAVVETDPVVVKALAAIAQDTPSCAGAPTARASSIDVCDRFANADKCWTNSPVSTATVPCFTWSMMVAASAACTAPASPAAAHVDAQAWDDSQDGHESEGCAGPCIAGGGCSGGACKCPADEAPCAGGCGRRKSDVVNCGACGNTCAAGVACVEGVCGGAADAGASDAGASDASADADAGDGG